MSAKHKPGPWIFDDSTGLECIKDANGEYIIEDQYHEICVHARTADMRLIAAAPELLEALEKALPDLSGQDLLRARAAIAKATGQDAQA